MILVIGDTSTELAEQVCSKFNSATLVTDSNYTESLATDGVYYTGLGDLTFDQIRCLALAADRVIFCKDLPWTDVSAQLKTKTLCRHLQNFIAVEDFESAEPNLFLTQSVKRKFAEPTLWTFGCSFTAGVGLVDPEQECYGRRLADELSMPWQNVAQAGSSTKWSLTHLLHSELESNDIVVWAATSPERFRRATSLGIEEMLLKDSSRSTIDFFDQDQIRFEYLDQINTGVRYLRSRNIKFVLINLLWLPDDQLEHELSAYKEWCSLGDWSNVDRGTDGLHIGPLGHQYIAKRISTQLQLLRYV